MIHCKKHMIAAGFCFMLPLAAWSEAPVVDDSDNFAMMDSQQSAKNSAGYSGYKQYPVAQDTYSVDESSPDEGPALVQDDSSTENNSVNSSARLIDKVQNLQQEIQELRGQLEVQAHDLKLLQEQQRAFYKDLDSRISSAKPIETKPAINVGVSDTKPSIPEPVASPAKAPEHAVKAHSVEPIPTPVSRANPADEQISYMAAYEFVKNKQYDSAINAMQSFVKKYPNGSYSANAEYWLGELYLVKKEYTQSINHFEIVLHQFPSSSKSAASLLKSAYAYAASGNTLEAKKRLQDLIKTYPGTTTAQLAQSKLESINAL